MLRAVKTTRMQLWTSLKMGSFLGFKAEFAQVSFEENNEIFYSICLKEENHRAIDEAFTAVCQKPISVPVYPQSTGRAAAGRFSRYTIGHQRLWAGKRGHLGLTLYENTPEMI